MSLEELAELFARFPYGNGFQISPDGDRFFAYVNRNGEKGLVVVELDEIGGGLEKGRFLEPDSQFELDNPGWIDNDLIAFNKVVDDIGYIGYQIVSCDKDRNLLQYIELISSAEMRFFNFGAPSLKRKFFVSEGLMGTWGKRYQSVALLEIDKHMDVDEVAVWKNPGMIENWYIYKDRPLAILVDGETYSMDFDALQVEQMPDEDTVRYELEPMNLPGTIEQFVDENIALISLENDEGFRGIAWYNVKQGEIIGQPLYVDGYDVNPGKTARVLELRAGGPVVGLTYHKDKPKCFYLDRELGKVMKHLEKAMAPGVARFLGLSKDSRFVFYEVLSDTHGTTIGRFDLKSGENQPVYHTRPWLQGMQLPSRNPITFTNRDGDTIHGYLTLPMDFKEGNPVPLVALSHGGPWVRDFWGFDEEAQFLAALGLAVLQVNFRGSDGFGNSYGLDEDLITISEESPKDVVDGVRWAIDQGYADEQRIGFYGGSFGAYLSLACAALEPDLAACAIGFAGVYDFTLMLEEDIRKERIFAEDLYSDYEEKAEFYESLSPVNQADRIKAPVLLIHGGRDERVSTKQAKDMEKALKDNGGDVTLIKKNFMLHGFDNEKRKRQHYEEIGAFLLKHLRK
ncbi:MAG: alpha/beta hydrolase family protein [Puniceicoccaceae bacterium]